MRTEKKRDVAERMRQPLKRSPRHGGASALDASAAEDSESIDEYGERSVTPHASPIAEGMADQDTAAARTHDKAMSNARTGPMPPALEPQLATLVEAPPEQDDWLYEIKYDGYRLLARIAQEKV